MGERDPVLHRGVLFGKQPGRDSLVESHQRFGQVGQQEHVRQPGRTTQDRGGDQEPAGVRRAAGQPGEDHQPERPRCPQQADLAVQGVGRKLLQQGTGVQRVTPGHLVQAFGSRKRQWPPAHDAREFPQVLDSETGQPDPLGTFGHDPSQCIGQPHRAVRGDRAVRGNGQHAQHRIPAQPTQRERQRLLGVRIGPADIVDSDHQNLSAGSEPTDHSDKTGANLQRAGRTIGDVRVERLR